MGPEEPPPTVCPRQDLLQGPPNGTNAPILFPRGTLPSFSPSRASLATEAASLSCSGWRGPCAGGSQGEFPDLFSKFPMCFLSRAPHPWEP